MLMATTSPQTSRTVAVTARGPFGTVDRIASCGRRMRRLTAVVLIACLSACQSRQSTEKSPTDVFDPVRELQNAAVATGRSSAAHWGTDPQVYAQWSNHTNRLIPVYTFGTREGGPGIDLGHFTGHNSVYRSEAALERLYGRVPSRTVNAHAEYMDQTDVFRLQKAAMDAGRKFVFLVIFDGMDWESSRAAAIVHTGRVFHEQRGSGLFFLDYAANETTQFAFMVTSPYGEEPRLDLNTQSVARCEPSGGYDPEQGGHAPWSTPTNPQYLQGLDRGAIHAVTDSAASATSMTAGIKTYNRSINVTMDGRRVETIAHLAQRAGYAVGVVTSVPISHATPAAAYAHNISRTDYQDLTRDMVGLKSVSHPQQPLPGVDALIGTGFGVDAKSANDQGDNFVAGNLFITAGDLQAIDCRFGGKYVVSLRTNGLSGRAKLLADADEASRTGRRLFGFFGTRYEHLPYETVDGDFRPANDKSGQAQLYTTADILENPTLAEMTQAALTVLEATDDRFWMMVEAGDVDLAMHQNNLDNMIGAIYSGDKAVRVIADWVEKHSNWNESLMIVTADHGHHLVIDDPHALARLRRTRNPTEELGE
jgi:alkaline phosphatase